MTTSPRRDELFEQCLRRVKNHRTQHGLTWSDRYQVELASEVATIIRQTQKRNPARIPVEVRAADISSVPATYVDDVIHYYLMDAPRVQRLLQRNDPLWKDLIKIIEAHARKRLAGRYNPAYYHTSLDDLLREVVNQTFVKLAASAFETYYFDCPLNLWLGMYAYHTAQELLHDALKYQQSTESLEKVLPGTADLVTGEVIPDPHAQKEHEIMLARLVIERAWPALSPDQAEVISRRLEGQSTQEIAHAMQRECKAIYSLERRAVVQMQRYLKLLGEF